METSFYEGYVLKRKKKLAGMQKVKRRNVNNIAEMKTCHPNPFHTYLTEYCF